MNRKVKFAILSIILIVYIVAMIPKAFQNDTFFDIALGEKIIEKGLTNEEELVFHEGLEFKNPRWLFDYFCAHIYNASGELGISLMVLIIGCLEMLFYFYITYKISGSLYAAFFYSIIVGFFTRHSYTARGQLISFFMFLIEFYAIQKYFETYKKRYLFITILVMPIIAYMHGSIYVMTISFFVPYIAEYILSKIKKLNFEGKLIVENRKIALLIIPIIAFVLIGLFTPNNLNLLTYSYKTMQGEKHISEMEPVNFFDDILFTVSLSSLFIILVFSKTKIRITDLLYIVGYSIVTFKASRGIYYFYLFSTICLFRVYCDHFRDYVGEVKLSKKSKKIIGTIGVLIIIYIITYSTNIIVTKLNSEYVPYEEYPVDVANYLIQNVDYKNAHIYTDYNYGSYLEFRGIPVFLDSRAELFTPAFNEDTTILEDYYSIAGGRVNYNVIFDKYGIDYVVLQKAQQMPYNYIKSDDKWEAIYDDISFVIYKRK